MPPDKLLWFFTVSRCYLVRCCASVLYQVLPGEELCFWTLSGATWSGVLLLYCIRCYLVRSFASVLYQVPSGQLLCFCTVSVATWSGVVLLSCVRCYLVRCCASVLYQVLSGEVWCSVLYQLLPGEVLCFCTVSRCYLVRCCASVLYQALHGHVLCFCTISGVTWWGFVLAYSCLAGGPGRLSSWWIAVRCTPDKQTINNTVAHKKIIFPRGWV